MNSDTYVLKVFHERELEQLLQKLNLLEKLRDGKLACFICNKTITPANFGAVCKKEGKVHVVCEDERCIAGVENLGRN